MGFYWILPICLLIGGCLAATRDKPAEAPPVSRVHVVEPVELPESFELPERKHPEHSTYSVLEEPAPESSDDDTAGIAAEDLEDNVYLSEEQSDPPEHEGLTLLPKEITFDFPMVDNERVRYYIDYYVGTGRKEFTRLLKKAERYIPYMRKIFKEEGLPEDLTYLAMVESGFNPRAYSYAHASGPWQFIESTGRYYGLRNNWWRDERRDFEKSTRAAARLLGDLHERFEGDWFLAVAAYNAGGGAVSRAVESNETTDFWELSASSSLGRETRNYLPKFLAMMTIAKNPEQYGFVDIEGLNPFDYEVVSVSGVIDLEVVAKLCEVSHKEIKSLNPELKRWCTPPGVKSYDLRLPVGKKSLFEKRYAEIPADGRINCKRHRIVNGDTLGSVARKYQIRLADLIAMNKIKDPRRLRIGDEVLLPMRQGEGGALREQAVATAESHGRSYRVRNGDSLWSIAKRFGVGTRELCRWNQLNAKSILQPGRKLVVSGRENESVKVVARTVAADRNGARKIVYRVKSGDTLTDIGRRYSVPTEQIKDWNQLTDNHILHPGDKLTLLIVDEQQG